MKAYEVCVGDIGTKKNMFGVPISYWRISAVYDVHVYPAGVAGDWWRRVCKVWMSVKDSRTTIDTAPSMGMPFDRCLLLSSGRQVTYPKVSPPFAILRQSLFLTLSFCRVSAVEAHRRPTACHAVMPPPPYVPPSTQGGVQISAWGGFSSPVVVREY